MHFKSVQAKQEAERREREAAEAAAAEAAAAAAAVAAAAAEAAAAEAAKEAEKERAAAQRRKEEEEKVAKRAAAAAAERARQKDLEEAEYLERVRTLAAQVDEADQDRSAPHASVPGPVLLPVGHHSLSLAAALLTAKRRPRYVNDERSVPPSLPGMQIK